MSGTRRRGRERKPKKGDGVSLADRLGPTSHHEPGGESVLASGSSAPLSRRALRQQRKQEARRRQTIIIGVVAALAVLLATVWWVTRDHSTVAPPSSDARTERSLAMTLAAPGQQATSGALMVVDSVRTSAGAVLVPSRVFVDGPTPEGVPFSDTVLLGAKSAPGVALADTLDVIVDGTWQLSPDALAAMVDGVGGVVVDVDTDILVDAGNGDQRVLVTAGDAQELNGAQAVAFAQYLGPREPEELRLARFGQVLDQLTQKLPNDVAEMSTLLTKTGAADRTTGSTAQLAAFLVAFGDASRADSASFQTLPTTPLQTGGPKTSLVADSAGVARLRQTVLAGSVPTDAVGTNIKVLVENGVGTPGLEQVAADLLRKSGYEFVNGGNASQFGNEKTDILIPDSTAASIQLGNSVAETLGLPKSAVQTTDQGSSVADVIVILGADFKS